MVAQGQTAGHGRTKTLTHSLRVLFLLSFFFLFFWTFYHWFLNRDRCQRGQERKGEKEAKKRKEWGDLGEGK